MSIPAQLRGWGAGWPTNRAGDMATVRTMNGQTLRVHKVIAPLVQFLIDEVERRGYLIHQPGDTPDDWGYANRNIAGTKSPSNHSWGLAIDIDATRYPMGTHRNPPRWIVDLFEAYGFEWGGDWKRPDPMHFEFRGSIDEARFLVASLAAGHLVGKPAPIPHTIPPPYQPRFPEDKMTFLVQAEGDPKVYITDLVTKTHVTSRKNLGGMQVMLGSRGLPNTVTVVDAAWLASIPTNPSDSERLKTIAYVIEGARK